MAKYDPLRDYLAGMRDDIAEVRMTFAEIEQFVGPLPAASRSHRAWWANDSKPQSQSWRAAGWHVETVDQIGEQVVFTRGVLDLGAYAEPVGPAADWLSEAEVRTAIVRCLGADGWAARRESGHVCASRAGRTLLVRIIGAPGADPEPARVRQRYATALLDAMQARDTHDRGAHETALALPDVAAYRHLVDSTSSSLTDLGLSVLFVQPDGRVSSSRTEEIADDAPQRVARSR
ncbi:hypothetical protein SAMN05216266_103242 [Amycolatopsis marina]|uniref:DUF7662 domain-containing protein n=1 Tax=Amycolatopsis marina TaxID=490629 RepID=A0A1I0XJB8_9PSEU|nr:hypothetical protein [Amycolatopsis marina]SFB00787.1 hypothetical protein SAMN05216266_103242 [Amycolatopsis marina]